MQLDREYPHPQMLTMSLHTPARPLQPGRPAFPRTEASELLSQGDSGFRSFAHENFYPHMLESPRSGSPRSRVPFPALWCTNYANGAKPAIGGSPRSHDQTQPGSNGHSCTIPRREYQSPVAASRGAPQRPRSSPCKPVSEPHVIEEPPAACHDLTAGHPSTRGQPVPAEVMRCRRRARPSTVPGRANVKIHHADAARALRQRKQKAQIDRNRKRTDALGAAAAGRMGRVSATTHAWAPRLDLMLRSTPARPESQLKWNKVALTRLLHLTAQFANCNALARVLCDVPHESVETRVKCHIPL